MDEKIIVSLTTWSARIANIPMVLDTILHQTIVPDLIVLNLSYGEDIPCEVQQYIERNKIEVNFVEDTKVYKKLLPTLKRYPEALVISIDDDWLYPPQMIEDFVNVHNQYPNNPISGNRLSNKSMNSHCGCASLTRYDFFGKYFGLIDEFVMHSCPSDDMVYTYFITKNGYEYKRTSDEYFINMESLNPISPYSVTADWPIERSYDYLINRFENCVIREGTINTHGFNLLVRLSVHHDYQLPYFISKLQDITNCRITLSVVSGFYDKACMNIAEKSFYQVYYSTDCHLAAEGFDYVFDLNTMGFGDIPQSYYLWFRDEISWRNAVLNAFLSDSDCFAKALELSDNCPLRAAGGSVSLYNPKSLRGVRIINPVAQCSFKERMKRIREYFLSVIFCGPEMNKYLVVLGRVHRVSGRLSLQSLFGAVFHGEGMS